MSSKILDASLRVKLAVLFFITVALPVTATDLSGIIIPEEAGWHSRVSSWEKYMNQKRSFSAFTHPSTAERQDLNLPATNNGLYISLADGLTRTLSFFLDPGLISSNISILDDLLKIRTLNLRPMSRQKRTIALAAIAQIALYRYKEYKGDLKELLTVNYWRDYFINQHQEEELAFHSRVSDNLNTRAVAAAIAVNKVYGKFYGSSQLQETSGMSTKMFNNFVKEIDKAASWVMTKHALTATRATSDLTLRFNLAMMLGGEGRPPEERKKAYELLDNISKESEGKDSGIQAMTLFQMARLLHERTVKVKECPSINILFSKPFVDPKEEKQSDDPTAQYATLLYFKAMMIAKSDSVVISLAKEALEKIIEEGGDSSQIKKGLKIFHDDAEGLWAEDKDGEHVFRLGRVFNQGIKGLDEYKQDKNLALHYWLKATQKGHIKAQYGIAYIWEQRGDRREAFEWYKKLAEQGHADAQEKIARMFENGEGTAQDLEKAFYWYQKAAGQGNVAARYGAALILKGRADKEEKDQQKKKKYFQEAFQWFLESAQQGDADAPFWVAYMHEEGEGTNKNLEEGLKWYLKSAQQGDVDAQHKIAEAWHQNRKDDKDLEEVFKWYQKAAAGGNVSAQFEVAKMFENGEGTDKDLEEAFKWYQKAAAGGNVSAQFDVAWMYYNGEKINKNLNMAFEWYQKAAEQEDATAQYNLATMYENKQGRAADIPDFFRLKKAFEWYQKAAEQGNAAAQYAVARMLESSQGTDKNLDKALEWYQRAAEQGYQDAQEKVKSLTKPR